MRKWPANLPGSERGAAVSSLYNAFRRRTELLILLMLSSDESEQATKK